MRYVTLACDYDGTLAHNGRVSASTVAAIERLLASGRTAILVTGRELDDLKEVFPHLRLFKRIVAENGALVYDPATQEQKLLGEAPPPEFAARLEREGVTVSEGRVIVATWQPHEHTVLELIHELGLEHQVIFNKGAVMVLPPGGNKSFGLSAALEQLGYSPHNVVGVGDAENDHALLSACECGVAVANALPVLKERADYVTARDHGAGVEELVDQLVKDDLREVGQQLKRHKLLLGKTGDGELCLPAYGVNILVAGQSGSGKSTLVSGFIERLCNAKYQFCLMDPEGDYSGSAYGLTIGTAEHPPVIDEIMAALQRPDQNTTVNMLAVPVDDRPRYFATLLPRILELRARVGRPHWLVLDEAHHLLSESADPSLFTSSERAGGLLMVTVHPTHVSRAALGLVDLVIAVGADHDRTFEDFSRVLGAAAPPLVTMLDGHNAVVWFRRDSKPPFSIVYEPAAAERRRHMRKYAQGELPADRNFVFRGADGRLNLRAQNLHTFLQMGAGVDDETWLHHLRSGDYSKWFHEAIKDEVLAQVAKSVEADPGITADEGRKAIRQAIEGRYTVPA